MHLCAAHIALGGDTNNVVFRGPDNPVSWPEIGIIQFLHGEEAVYNIEVIGERDARPAIEKERLLLLYGPSVNEIYPGKVPVMEMEMPGTSLKGKESGKRGRSKGHMTVKSLDHDDEHDLDSYGAE